MTMEYKQVQADAVRPVNAARGEFAGYLAIFGNLDFNGDVIEQGAFKATLAQLEARRRSTGSKFLLPLLWMHDENEPIGAFTTMREDSKGLYVEGMCDLDIPQGQRVFSGMQKGYAAQLSIGFQPVKVWRDSKGVRHLTEARLLEGSAVTTGFAANELAAVTATKGRRDNMGRQYQNYRQYGYESDADTDARWAALAAWTAERQEQRRAAERDLKERTPPPIAPEPLRSAYVSAEVYEQKCAEWVDSVRLHHVMRAGYIPAAELRATQARETAERDQAYRHLIERKAYNGNATLAEVAWLRAQVPAPGAPAPTPAPTPVACGHANDSAHVWERTIKALHAEARRRAADGTQAGYGSSYIHWEEDGNGIR